MGDDKRISVDMSSGLYGAGVLFATGVALARHHGFLGALARGLCSWMYIGFIWASK